MGVWAFGRVGVWACGCVGVWVCGCVLKAFIGPTSVLDASAMLMHVWPIVTRTVRRVSVAWHNETVSVLWRRVLRKRAESKVGMGWAGWALAR